MTWKGIASLGSFNLYRPIPSVLYRTISDSLYWTIDYGETWNFKGVLPLGALAAGNPAIVISPTDPNTLYLGSSSFDGGIFRTTNGGVNWSAVISGFGQSKSVATIAIDPANPSVLYAGGNASGVYRTSNRGDQWALISSSLPDKYILGLAIDTAGTLYCGSGAGVFSSSDQGSTWGSLTGNLQALDMFNVLPQNSSTIYASGLGGAYRSTNGGISWQSINNGLLDTDLFALALDPSNPNILYAGTYGGLIYKSTDGGSSWVEKTVGLPSLGHNVMSEIKVHPKDPTWVWANGYQSTNSGDSWIPLTILGRSVNQLTCDPSHPDTLYTTFGDTLMRTMNRGITWTVKTTGTYLSVITVDPNDPDILYADGGGILRSSDGGLSWQLVDSTSASSFYVNPQQSSHVYAPTFYNGIRRSTNGGKSWASYNNGMPCSSAFSVRSATNQPHTLFAATYGGGINRIDETFTSVISEKFLGDGFYLSQNYPNPFNPNTTIRYGLPHKSIVSLTIYNTLGQKITSLVQEMQEAGYHEVTFGESGLASGVYYYRLRVGNLVETKKLLMIR